ncbi:hypothetical protein DERP_013812 [Dermatophagoides pteronyssinus]|uniref:Uncharacterized protein n=1 Tax=Dermatophagoides pteronyssinus TaxID=6956 RepID=A0ABQ8JCN6_DERPT|nr:hypothetical protein DERP_013812 [Dermatophagoides pteronyssinus]
MAGNRYGPTIWFEEEDDDEEGLIAITELFEQTQRPKNPIINNINNEPIIVNDCHPNIVSQTHFLRTRRNEYGATPNGSLSILTHFNEICTSPA